MALSLPKQRVTLVLTRTGSGLAGAWRSFVSQMRVQSAAAEHRRLESQKLDRYQQMGRIVYEMFLEDRVKTKRLQGLCQSVADLDAASREAASRVAAIRRDRPSE